MEPDLANLKFSAADLDKRLPASPSARVLPLDANTVKERAWYHYTWYAFRQLYLKVAGGKFTVNSGTPGQDEGALRKLEALGFSRKEIGRMYTVFLMCDRDNTGIIQQRDFKRFFDLGAHNIYIDRIFQILDRDGDNAIAFDEFTAVLHRYCVFDRDALAKFAFALVDKNANSFLDRDEVSQYMETIYGRANARRSKQRLDDAMRTFGKSDKDVIGVSLAEWLAFSPRCPTLLFPAFHVQDVLRQRTLGVAAWQRLSTVRVERDDRKRNIYETLGGMKVKHTA